MIVVHERDQRVTMLDILPDGTLAPTDFAVHVPGAAFAFIA
jgi:6-phosphogluconolactonase